MKISYNNLWKRLIDKKIKKTELIEQANITSNALSKLSKNESVPLETLTKVCNVLDCKIDDIVEYE